MFGFFIESLADKHFYIIVTKQPARAAQFARWLRVEYQLDLSELRNLMLMVSVTDQATANARIPDLLRAGSTYENRAAAKT